MKNSRELAMNQSMDRLAEDVETRRSRERDIRAAVDAFLLRERGIAGFCDLLDEELPTGEGLTLMLGRQLPTVSLENMTVELLAQWMSVRLPTEAQTVGFRRDCWASNAYKQSLTSLPLLRRVKGGMADVRVQKIVPKENRGGLGKLQPLAAIAGELRDHGTGVTFSEPLPEVHRLLRRKIGANGDALDVSRLWERCARSTTRAPKVLFHECDGQVLRTERSAGECDGYVRPPADWYYLPYLCMFLTGQRALAATTIEEDDESIRTFFVENIAKITEAIGVEPLIVWMPHYSDRIRRQSGQPLNFTEMPLGLFHDGWKEKIEMPERDIACYDAAYCIVHQLAMLNTV